MVRAKRFDKVFKEEVAFALNLSKEIINKNDKFKNKETEKTKKKKEVDQILDDLRSDLIDSHKDKQMGQNNFVFQ